MQNRLDSLKPKKVWEIFEKICSIPRPSKHEEKIREYLIDFSKRHNLHVIEDNVGNIIIKKSAYPGFEKKTGVILQSHMDMVPQKADDIDHDFLKDHITPYIDGNVVRAKGTTLGADNGIGIATSLAILISKDIKHGPLEALFTVDEESGMTGAQNLNPNQLDGKILINLDSETHGEIFIGCAGGARITAKANYNPIKLDSNNYSFYKIKVYNLKGGHSGVDIILQRGNAIKILIRLLHKLNNIMDIKIGNISGGTLQNAIPRIAFCNIAIPSHLESRLKDEISSFEKIIQDELSIVDPDVSITLEKREVFENILPPKIKKNIINLIMACPHGVYRMSDEIKGLVETSNNLATIMVDNGIIKIETSQRSSIDSQKENMINTVKSLFKLANMDPYIDSTYPGWKPNTKSKILNIAKKCYVSLFNEEPKIMIIHAGLECGLFKSKKNEWDIISIGPTIRYPHSPSEEVDIKSVEKFFKLLVKILESPDL